MNVCGRRREGGGVQFGTKVMAPFEVVCNEDLLKSILPVDLHGMGKHQTWKKRRLATRHSDAHVQIN
jgi:hypothetical protein